MACEEEKRVFEEARDNVKSLRQELKDMTGSDKPGDSAPSGQGFEGTTAANAELADVRQRLQLALEDLSKARIALHRCRNPREERDVEDVFVNIGVLLEKSDDRKWMVKNLAHDESLDYVIVPKDFNHMLKYFGELGRKEILIRKLVLMGHGSSSAAHIGSLTPDDVDFTSLQAKIDEASSKCKKHERQIRSLKKKLDEATDENKKLKITEQIEEAADDLYSNQVHYDDYKKRYDLLKDAGEAFAENARIGLLSCYAAYDDSAKTMMRNIGKVFLEKRGGDVVGFSGIIWNPERIHPVISFLAGTDDVIALPFGNKEVISVRAGRCGAVSNNFERYGYCDRPVSKKGSYCWQHR